MINNKNFITYLVLVIASLVGSFSLLLFGFFVYGYSFTIVELGFSSTGVLAWDSMLCLLFFIQHSVMIRKGFRKRLVAIIPVQFQGTLYTAASGAVLIGLVLFWQNSEQELVSLQGIARWVAHGIFFISLMGMLWGLHALRSFDAFGNQQVLAHIRDSSVTDMPLTIRGPYRWVRHPLYFFTLLMIWCCPEITVDRLLFNILFTVWIVLGTMLEERDLVAEYQGAYENYQRRVPMLIPWKIQGWKQ